MQDYAKKFYKSKQWERCREGYLSRVGGLCEPCLKAGRFTPAEIVHHKTFITPENINDPTITLNFENLEAVCRVCHAEKHSGNIKRFEVDELGRVTAM